MIISVKMCPCGEVKVTSFKSPSKMKCVRCEVYFVLDQNAKGQYIIEFGKLKVVEKQVLPKKKPQKKVKQVECTTDEVLEN